MASRFEKFSERAQIVLSHSQEEAERLNHNYIGAEHILLGLVRETDGVAARILSSLGVELSQIRSAVESIIAGSERPSPGDIGLTPRAARRVLSGLGVPPSEVPSFVESIIARSERPSPGDIGLTPRAKICLMLAVDEARRLTDDYVGTEHLLIGLMREGEGEAARVLESLGVSQDKVRAEAKRIISKIRPQITSAFERALRRIELMSLSELAQAEVAAGPMSHPAKVVERRITNLIVHDNYIRDPSHVAMYMYKRRNMSWWGEIVWRGKTLWRRRRVYDPAPGPVVVSARKVRELGLAEDELEAIMLHEMGHAIIAERDGVDRPVLPEDDETEEPDREAKVDEWMRANGFEAEASILKDRESGRR